MRNGIKAAAIMTIAGTAGMAHANFVVTGDGEANTDYFFNSPSDSSFAFDQAVSALAENGSFDLPWALNSSTHGSIDQWNQSFSGSVVSSSSEFSFNASSSIQGTLNEPISFINGFAQSQTNVFYSTDIQVMQATDVTISFDGFASGTDNAISRTEFSVQVSSMLGSFVDFSAGFNTGSQITNPFSFETTLIAGDVIEIDIIFENDSFEGPDAQTTRDQSLNASFSITTVPTPSSAAAIGFGGLIALRRRRGS